MPKVTAQKKAKVENVKKYQWRAHEHHATQTQTDSIQEIKLNNKIIQHSFEVALKKKSKTLSQTDKINIAGSACVCYTYSCKDYVSYTTEYRDHMYI